MESLDLWGWQPSLSTLTTSFLLLDPTTSCAKALSLGLSAWTSLRPCDSGPPGPLQSTEGVPGSPAVLAQPPSGYLDCSEGIWVWTWPDGVGMIGEAMEVGTAPIA